MGGNPQKKFAKFEDLKEECVRRFKSERKKIESSDGGVGGVDKWS